MESLRREQIIAFRLARHYLSQRLPKENLLEVAKIGIQNTPPTSGLLSFGARLDPFEANDLDLALTVHKTLIELWSLRGAPYIVPTVEAAIFTTGLLPDGEEAAQFFIRGSAEHLRRFGLSALQAAKLTADAIQPLFTGRQAMKKDELGVKLADSMARELPSEKLGLWNTPDGLRDNTYGQSLARYALSIVALQGLLCFVPGSGKEAARFTLTEKWLGSSLPQMEIPAARAELARRFLRYHGPGDQSGFARWTGVAPGFARATWEFVSGELIPVTHERKTYFLLGLDADALLQAQLPQGVRLLPPHDPYLSAPDRLLLVPDKSLHARLWRITANPGAVLVDGEIAGLWRPQKKGDRFTLRVEPFQNLLPDMREQIEREAIRMARLRQVELEKIEYVL